MFLDEPGSTPATSSPGHRAILRQALLRQLLGFCLFGAAYYVAYRYGMSFAQAGASPFWFPDSVLLCGLLLTRPGQWWLFIGVTLPIRVFSEVANGIPLWFLLATFAIDSVRGVLTATALRRFLMNPIRIDTAARSPGSRPPTPRSRSSISSCCGPSRCT
ncbi:MAG TPA: hypothetical protein VFX14_04300 [Methylomirabilota bacterium]|nr:hypothetical protein [Methylomirabilota bacterium]